MLILFILFAAIIGSFLNMLIYRLPKMLDGHNISPIYPKKSFCPSCKNTIKAIHLIPVISFIMCMGKCRYCDERIPISYLLVEVFSIISSVIIYHFVGFNYQLIFWLLLNYALIALFFIDYKYYLLPDIITIPIMWLGIIYNLIYGDLPNSVLGAIFGYLILWICFWVFKILKSKDGMGYGDFKLAALIGAWFGVQSLNFIILISAILGILYFLLFVRQIEKEFAFGTMLVLAVPIYLSIQTYII